MSKARGHHFVPPSSVLPTVVHLKASPSAGFVPYPLDSVTQSRPCLKYNMPAATHKPSPKDVSNHFSRVTKHRVPSQVKRFYQYFAIPGIGNLAGGIITPPGFEVSSC